MSIEAQTSTELQKYNTQKTGNYVLMVTNYEEIFFFHTYSCAFLPAFPCCLEQKKQQLH